MVTSEGRKQKPSASLQEFEEGNEMLGVVNEAGRVIGQASKGECHTRGLLHRSVFVCIFTSGSRLYLQRRANTKMVRPGKLTASACGHVRLGESTLSAANRELREELGIHTRLKRIGQILGPYNYDREIVTVYIGYWEGNLVPNLSEISTIEALLLTEIASSLEDPEMNFGETFKKVFRAFQTRLEQESVRTGPGTL